MFDEKRSVFSYIYRFKFSIHIASFRSPFFLSARVLCFIAYMLSTERIVRREFNNHDLMAIRCLVANVNIFIYFFFNQ